MTRKIYRKENTRKNATENKVLFSLLLSLEIEENKRGREMKGYYALKLCNFLFPITYM